MGRKLERRRELGEDIVVEMRRRAFMTESARSNREEVKEAFLVFISQLDIIIKR